MQALSVAQAKPFVGAQGEGDQAGVAHQSPLLAQLFNGSSYNSLVLRAVAAKAPRAQARVARAVVCR
jgi:hypothetical protein